MTHAYNQNRSRFSLTGILRMVRSIKLCSQYLAAANPHFYVNMWRPAGVGDGDDRTEPETAVRTGYGMAEALKGMVARVPSAVTGVEINAVHVALPDFDPCLANRPSFCVQNPPIEEKNVSARLAQAVLHPHKVGVIVPQFRRRVEWAFGTAWSRRDGRQCRHR